MKNSIPALTRREFTKTALLSGAAATTLGTRILAADVPARRIRTGVIGCGRVSNLYLPVLSHSPFVEVVSLCDIRPEKARQQGERFKISNTYPDIDSMLKGVPFDFLIVLTDMQEHEQLNRRGIEAGKHVWSEKPIANTLRVGQELLRMARARGVQLWGAPITVQSPQFAFMSRTLRSGALGRVAAAHAFYGHEGPNWSAFFYEKLGGSMPDLGVYNFTSLTGLLGPVKSVTAMLSIVTPERTVDDKGRIRVTEEDNAMVLMEHADGVLSHVQSGFNYFNPNGHTGENEDRHTIQITGSKGYMGLVGYDWEPLGVDLATKEKPNLTRHQTHAEGYIWQQGAVLAAESLSTGRKLLVTPEQALHVLEIITAARKSQATGRRIRLTSTFDWPLAV